MVLAISKAAERLAEKHGIELVAHDEHCEARFIGSGITFTGGSAKAAIDQALLSRTEGGSAQDHERRATEPRQAMPEDAAEDELAERQEELHRIEKAESPEQTPEQLAASQPVKKKARKAKAKKPPRQKKAKKVKAPKRARRQREEGDEDEEGADDTASVVKAKYRKQYKPTKNTCGDPYIEAFETATRGEDGKIDIAKLRKVASDNGVDLKRWAHLKGRDGGPNVGMLRMNLGNVLRGKVRNGVKVKIGRQTFEPDEK